MCYSREVQYRVETIEQQNNVMKDYEGEFETDDHIVQQRRMVSRECGFAPHQDRPYDFPVSRDWADIDCKATGCRFNQQEKCITPSRCKIATDGHCEGFDAIPMKPRAELDGD